jgi:dienelactone hydrolase
MKTRFFQIMLLAVSFTVSNFFVRTKLAEAAIVKKDLEYNLAGKKYEGYLAYDDSIKGPRPGVLVAHNWMGVTEETKSKVDRFAGLGYIAFAVDIYGKNSRPKNVEEAAALSAGFKKDRVPLRNRMHQGLKVLKEQKYVDKTRIAVTGYCFGGTAALELGRAGGDVKAIVSFHGGLDSPKPQDGAKIKGRVLALHGADDPYVKAEELAAFEKEMRDHKVDWQLIKYGGTVHSFTEKEAGTDNSKGAAYNASADARSWEAMKQLFAEALK